jgi:DNA-binding NarL/FixJ family response regulator
MTAVTEFAPQTDIPYAGATTASPEPIRLLAVDDHPAVRRALRGLLEEQPDFELVAVVDGPEAAILSARDARIDVAVVDYQLGDRHSGLWLCRELKRLPGPPKVLIYSAYCDALLAAAAVVAQADGILSKGGLGWELCEAIRDLTREHLPLPIAPRQLEDTIRSRLSDEDRIVFGMLLNGMSSDEVAAVLGCSPASLDSRVATILRKLQRVPAGPRRLRQVARVGVHNSGRRSALRGVIRRPSGDRSKR